MAEHQQVQKSTESKSNIQTRTIPPKQIPISNPMAIIQRARINPKSLTHADVMQLQRTIGNRAVGKLLTEIGLIPSKTKQAQPVQMQTIPEEEKELVQGKMVETIQRQEIPEEEEPLQGKMIEPIQRQEIPEEEEPLQGKFESTQRQEIPEEEEPLQGKFADPIQRQEISEEEEPLQGKFESGYEKEKCPSCIQRQEIPEEEEPMQGKMTDTVQRQEKPEEKPIQTKIENNTRMPDNLKAGVENLSGIDMSDVRVHYNSDKPAEVGALAYTQEINIHVAPGQERHLPHEAWHVVQQKQGRANPTMQMKGVWVNGNSTLETEASEMRGRALANIDSEYPGSVEAKCTKTSVAATTTVQMAPFKKFRRWLGLIGGPALGKSGRKGRLERQHQVQHPAIVLPPVRETDIPVREKDIPVREKDILDDYIKAYNTSRLYHGTGNRAGVLGGDNPNGLVPSTEMVSRDGSGGTLGRIFLANNYTTSQPYATDAMLRVYLGEDRTKKRNISIGGEYARGADLKNPHGELTRDAMGAGAFYTEKVIPATNIIDTILDSQVPQEKKAAIFAAIRSHMENKTLSDEDMMALHTRASDKKRLSVTVPQNSGT